MILPSRKTQIPVILQLSLVSLCSFTLYSDLPETIKNSLTVFCSSSSRTELSFQRISRNLCISTLYDPCNWCMLAYLLLRSLCICSKIASKVSDNWFTSAVSRFDNSQIKPMSVHCLKERNITRRTFKYNTKVLIGSRAITKRKLTPLKLHCYFNTFINYFSEIPVVYWCTLTTA